MYVRLRTYVCGDLLGDARECDQGTNHRSVFCSVVVTDNFEGSVRHMEVYADCTQSTNSVLLVGATHFKDCSNSDLEQTTFFAVAKKNKTKEKLSESCYKFTSCTSVVLCIQTRYLCDRRQQRLVQHIADGHFTHLLLFILDGQFEPAEVHPLAVFEGGPGRVVVEQHLQLVRAARVVEQGGGEVLTSLPQLLPASERVGSARPGQQGQVRSGRVGRSQVGGSAEMGWTRTGPVRWNGLETGVGSHVKSWVASRQSESGQVRSSRTSSEGQRQGGLVVGTKHIGGMKHHFQH